jgi:hypothetical protein
LLDRAAGASMLVVGSFGDGAWTGMLASSLAVTLIDRAPCPVAVVRGSAPQVPPPRSGLLAVCVTADVVAAMAEAQLAAVRLRYPALPDSASEPERAAR